MAMRASRWARTGAGLLAAGAVVLGAPAAAGALQMAVYRNIPNKLSRGMSSIGFEATSTSQFGGLIEASPKHKARANPRVTFVLDDWACQSGGGATCTTKPHSTYVWPITVDIYEVGAGNTLGALLASRTEPITVPYQPSTSQQCIEQEAPGAWFEKKSKECIYGYAFRANVEFPGVTLPSKAIVSVAYDTENYGAEPTGVVGPENSLNVALAEKAPARGADPLPEDVFVDSSWSEMYCADATDVGSFGDSGACWAPYQPAVEVSAEK